MQAHQRRIVRRRGHYHGTTHAVRAERIADELLYLAAALADQTDHRYIGIRIARHHAQQHRFADAAAREQTDTLAAAHADQTIDRPNAHIQGLTDGTPLQGIERLTQ